MISWVGIDISKSNLVVWVQPQKEGFEIPNTSEGFVELIKRLSCYEVGRVLLEATGGYERQVMAALQQTNFRAPNQSSSGQSLRGGHGQKCQDRPD